jgi:putative ABC transport system ATP-binding protein
MVSPVPVIELRAVERSFIEAGRRRVVLDGVSCAIAPGELVVLLGRSGSGKSTLLNLIAGIDLPSAGEVLLEGRSFNRLSEDERTVARRDRIGFVFQFFNLVPTLTVEENLLLPLELAGRATGAHRERALGLLEEVGLADRGGQFPDRLSAASSSGSPWRALWPPIRRSSSPTSRPEISISRPGSRCSSSSTGSRGGPGRPCSW